MDTRTDDYYKNWPRKLDDLDILHGYLLKSLTPAEELAAFLQLRGSALKDTGRIAEAQVSYANAYKLVPDKTIHLIDLAATVDQELERLARNDYSALGKRIKYTICRSMEPNDMANAWVYRYPKTPDARYGPLRGEANAN